MLKYLDEPPRSTSWVNHAVLAVSLGLNALFIFHALKVQPIPAQMDRGSMPSPTAMVGPQDATVAKTPLDDRCDRSDDRTRVEYEEPSLVPDGYEPELAPVPTPAPGAPTITEVSCPVPPASARVHL